MNRPIKFRAWDKRHTTMMTDHFRVCPDGDVLDISDDRMTNDTELMQFTGLLDKNGKEIYEGDVLKDANGNTDVVVWSDTDGCFHFPNASDWMDFTYSEIVTAKVIGNIYENPELLTPKEDSI